ncbi:MAG: hypothetical protein WKG01_38510 [Kofleriaceae bacterium]
MPSEPLILRDEVSPTDRRHLSVTLRDTGALRVEGHDLGDGVERAIGKGIREYEWMTEVEAADLPKLADALGGDPGADILDVIRRTCQADPAHLELTIRAAGIKPKFWSRFGD